MRCVRRLRPASPLPGSPSTPRNTGEAANSGSISEAMASRQSLSVGSTIKSGHGSFTTQCPTKPSSKRGEARRGSA